MKENARFKGLELGLHRYPGVRVLRVVHPREQDIDEHRHDWSYIGIYTAGRYLESYDGGEALMAGPSAVLHPSGRPHSDVIADEGLETLTIEFDTAWLRHHGFDRLIDRSQLWSGGTAARAAGQLARIVTGPCSEAEIGAATSRFLHIAGRSDQPVRPSWLERLEVDLLRTRPSSTAEFARRFDLHPAYLARAYRYAVGEGMHETVRRARVQRAAGLLRHSDMPLAEIALTAGFCDQSHMNRCFRSVLGRGPLAVRGEVWAS